jgi:CBS domain-containing protein
LEAAEEEPVTARELMTSNPTTVAPEASVAEVWDLMRELEIRHVPVVQDGALAGMVSDRDLGRLDIAGMLATPIVNVMSSDVIVVEPDSELSEIVELLLDHKVGALPVIRPDTREVVGIVSYIDVLRAVQDRLEEE